MYQEMDGIGPGEGSEGWGLRSSASGPDDDLIRHWVRHMWKQGNYLPFLTCYEEICICFSFFFPIINSQSTVVCTQPQFKLKAVRWEQGKKCRLRLHTTFLQMDVPCREKKNVPYFKTSAKTDQYRHLAWLIYALAGTIDYVKRGTWKIINDLLVCASVWT